MASMTVDNKLGVNRFLPDEKHSHIDVDKGYGDLKEIKWLVLACPAHLYVLEPGGKADLQPRGLSSSAAPAACSAAGKLSEAGSIPKAAWAWNTESADPETLPGSAKKKGALIRAPFFFCKPSCCNISASPSRRFCIRSLPPDSRRYRPCNAYTDFPNAACRPRA